MSRATWLSYSRAWASWEELLSQTGADWVSADLLPLMLLFIGSAFSDGVSYSATSKSVAAVAFWAKLRGLEDFMKSFSAGSQGVSPGCVASGHLASGVLSVIGPYLSTVAIGLCLAIRGGPFSGCF